MALPSHKFNGERPLSFSWQFMEYWPSVKVPEYVDVSRGVSYKEKNECLSVGCEWWEGLGTKKERDGRMKAVRRRPWTWLGEEGVSFVPPCSLHQLQWPIQGRCQNKTKQKMPTNQTKITMWKSEWMRKVRGGSEKKNRKGPKEEGVLQKVGEYLKSIWRGESKFLLLSSRSWEPLDLHICLFVYLFIC